MGAEAGNKHSSLDKLKVVQGELDLKRPRSGLPKRSSTGKGMVLKTNCNGS
jgi:hypothetical protein